MRSPASTLLIACAVASTACAPEASPVEAYVEAWFETFPSRATAAGRHDFDDRLERLDRRALAAWLEANRRTARELRRALAADEGSGRLDRDRRLDYELLLRRAERELFELAVERRPETDPLFWSGIPSSATVFLLVREDRPAEARLRSAAARARQVPALAVEASAALGASDPATIAPELCRLAAGQARASAGFFRDGLPAAVDRAAGLSAELQAELRSELAAAGGEAAAALDDMAAFLDDLAERASGGFRLGELYAARFRKVTGIERPVGDVLAEAEAALEAKRAEAAEYGRRVWGLVMGAAAAPTDERELLGRLFARVAEDRAATVEEFVADYRTLIAEAVEFVRAREVITLPEPLTLRVEPSPAFLLGASVGGVYAAGPYAPSESETLLFLPTPAAGLPPERLAAFFRDFNHHFNRMITPHEVIPGHYLQLKLAARHPHRARALFGDGVLIEGWGTFCERLMLDLGWGGPLDRLAHLKKQLENIARTVVDIRVHTDGMTEEQALRFVREEALQEEQFAANMWRRAMTTSPQLTYYHLGFREVWDLYSETRERLGDDFDLRAFMDGMMELGPVPIRHHRERILR